MSEIVKLSDLFVKEAIVPEFEIIKTHVMTDEMSHIQVVMREGSTYIRIKGYNSLGMQNYRYIALSKAKNPVEGETPSLFLLFSKKNFEGSTPLKIGGSQISFTVEMTKVLREHLAIEKMHNFKPISETPNGTIVLQWCRDKVEEVPTRGNSGKKDK